MGNRAFSRAAGWIICFLAFGTLVSHDLLAQDYRIAILPFKEVALSGEQRRFVENLPEMLASNLASSRGVTIVERSQIDRAMANYRLEATDLVDQASAVKVGSWVGATHIVLGTYTQIGQRVRIDLRVVDQRAGEVTTSAKVEGTTNELFDLVNEVSKRILGSLTGASVDFREQPRVVLDQTFQIRPPVPAPSREFYAVLHNSAEPRFTLSCTVTYESQRGPRPKFGLSTKEWRLPHWIKVGIDGAALLGDFNAKFMQSGTGPQSQTEVWLDGSRYVVTTQPKNVRLSSGEAAYFGRMSIITSMSVSVKIERAD